MISSQKDHPLKSWHFAKVLLLCFLSNCACVAWVGRGAGREQQNKQKIPKTLISQGQNEEQKQRFSTSYPEPQSVKQMTSVVTGQNT